MPYARVKLELTLFPKHRPHRFDLALRDHQVDKVYEEGEQIGFFLRDDPDKVFYEIDDEFG